MQKPITNLYKLILLLIAMGQVSFGQIISVNSTTPLPLTLNTTTPLPNANNISLDADIMVQLSDNIETNTVNNTTVIVTGSQTGIINGSLTVSGSMIIFNPLNNFKPGEIIRITLTTGISTPSGVSLSQNYVLQYTSAATVSFPSSYFEYQENAVTTVDGARSVYAADVDGDGDLDMLSASSDDNTIAWYENIGNQPPVKHIITTTVDSAYSVYAADVDGDGDLDILSASYSDDTIAWYENDGNQNFTKYTISTTADGAYAVYAADVDGDGDLDVLSASYSDDTIAWYENDGNQNFTKNTIDLTADGARSVYAADMDGDGDMDVLSAALTGDQIAWYENDGNQNFTKNVIITVNGAESVFAIDMDNDGDMDIVSAAGNADTVAWYENDGAQNFTANIITTTANGANSVFAADMDGDGDIDVLNCSFYDDTVAWYENDGTQNFTKHIITTTANGARSVYAADMDGDGDIDVISASQFDDTIAWYKLIPKMTIVSASPVNNTNTLAPNASLSFTFNTNIDGATLNSNTIRVTGSQTGEIAGSFTGGGSATVSFTPAAPYKPGEVIRVTITQDLKNIAQNLSGNGSLEYRVAPLAVSSSVSDYIVYDKNAITTTADGAFSVYAADVDGDGDMDMLSASLNDDTIAWYENDGTGNFIQQVITTTADSAASVYAADVDGDGDLDVLSASTIDDTIAWYQNDGSQNFTKQVITTTADGASSVYAADLDGDGDLDVLSASYVDNTIAWYENDGSQSFTKHVITNTASNARSVYAADVDGDGDMDVLSASIDDNTIAWYENDGNQNFTKHVITNTAYRSISVYAADVDSDGDMDVLSASYNDDTIVWYENDGSQNFTKHVITNTADNARSVYAADMDGDGDMDVLSASFDDDTIAWYENDGNQNFTKQVITTTADRARSVYAADVDGDGDLDVLSASYNDDTIAWYRFNGLSYIYDNDTWTPTTPIGNANPEDNVEVRSGATIFDGNLEIQNLQVDAGATLAIEGVLKVNGDLINNGAVTFKSTATGNGELGPVQPGAVVSGDFTVERYLTANRAYRMVTSAVNTNGTIHQNWQENASSNVDNPAPGYGTHITGTTVDQTDGFDATPSGNPSLFTLDVANQSFAVVANTDQNTLSAGSPFLLFSRGDRSIDVTSNGAVPTSTVLRATGQLLTGDVTQTYSTTNANDFIMFGNPYQATVDLNEVISESTNINANQYYVFDPSLGDHGAYVTVLLPSGTTTGSSTANQYLQPGEGAQIATVNNGTASLLFKETAKSTDNFTNAPFSTGNDPLVENAQILGLLYTTENYMEGKNEHDSFGLLFATTYSNAIEAQDATKPFNMDENLGIQKADRILSIERRNMPETDETIDLYTGQYRHTEYTLVLKISDVNKEMYLLDGFTGNTTELVNGYNEVDFTVNPNNGQSIDANRFSIHFENSLSITEKEALSYKLYPNPISKDGFTIESASFNSEFVNLVITDLQGRQIFKEEIAPNGRVLNIRTPSTMASGVYLVNLKDGDAEKTYQIIKE